MVVPNDMPHITPKTLEPLVNALMGFDAATYVYPNASRECINGC